jgi:hypothetical protein
MGPLAPSLRRAFRAAMPAAAALLGLALAATSAGAQEVRSIEPVYDQVKGTVVPGAPAKLLPIRLLEGAPFSCEVKADRGSALLPSVALLGPDRTVDGTAVFVVKGGKASLLNYVPGDTATHWIRIEGADGTGGPWTMKSKVKLPKKAMGTGEIGSSPVEFPFVGPGRAVASAKVTASPKEALAPVFVDLEGPAGTSLDDSTLKALKNGFSLAGAALPAQGDHALTFAPAPGAAPGTYKVLIKFKVTKGTARILDAANVITDPIPMAIAPEGGDYFQADVDCALDVDFAQPGAIVKFQSGSTVVTVPPGSITHVPGQLLFSLNLTTFAPATYDVVVLNPDGGSGTLAQAFEVEALSPSPVSVSPDHAYEGGVERLRISGTLFRGNMSVALKRGLSTIPGVVVGSGAGYVDADFDLAGAAIGAWDLAAVNPGAPATTLVGAFDVLRVVSVASMTPEDNGDGVLVDAVILGDGFLAGATATLVRQSDGFEIEGEDLVVVAMTEIHATFDTTDVEPASFDLVVTSPGGAVVTLESAFRTRRQKGPPSDPVSPFSPGYAADGPPGLAHDASRGGYLLAWVEEDGSGGTPAWHVYAQRLDSDGTTLGDPVSVSGDDGSAEKRYATAGYDPVNDEYLVCWTEVMSITPTQTNSQHPNGTSALPLFQVMAQRLAGADLAPAGSNVQVTDSTSYTGGGKKDTWVISDFNSYRPSVAFDEKAGLWQIAWMEEFDTSGLYFYDDFDVFMRSLDPQSSGLGSLVQVAKTDACEGDPALAWDPDGQRVLVAWVARPTAGKGDLDLYLGANGGGTLLLAANGDNLGDPALAVDAITGTVVVSWTRVATDGTWRAEAASVALADLSAVVGSPLVLAGTGTDFLVRPAANQDFEEVHLFWTRQDSEGFTAMLLTCTSSATEGLQAIDEEATGLSSADGDGGLPTAVYGSGTGDTAVVWMETITETGKSTYLGDSLPNGLLRGEEFWFQLYR